MSDDPDRLTLRLGPADRKLASQLARLEDRSLSSMIRVLIRDAAAQRGILGAAPRVRAIHTKD